MFLLNQRILTQLLGRSTVVACLISCAGNANVVGDVVRLAWQKEDSSDSTRAQVLNPQYRYLRANFDGRPFLLVLGYIDADPASGEPIDVWYTGQGEVLKFKNGRLLGMTGTQADWLAVRHISLPTWAEAAAMRDAATISYVRMRDSKASYQFGIQEQVTLQRIPAPPVSPLGGLPANDLVWLEERYSTRAHLPPSQFAVRQDATSSRVVYSRQCLSAQMCLSFQEWTPEDHAAIQSSQAGAVNKP